MIEVKDNYELEDIILTGHLAEDVKLTKSYKLTKHEKKRICDCFRIYAMKVLSEDKANQNLMRELRQLQPFSRSNFRRFRVFDDIMYDMEQIFMSDNVEFNLVRYMSRVLGIPFKDLGSAKKDWFIRWKYNYIISAER